MWQKEREKKSLWWLWWTRLALDFDRDSNEQNVDWYGNSYRKPPGEKILVQFDVNLYPYVVFSWTRHESVTHKQNCEYAAAVHSNRSQRSLNHYKTSCSIHCRQNILPTTLLFRHDSIFKRHSSSHTLLRSWQAKRLTFNSLWPFSRGNERENNRYVSLLIHGLLTLNEQIKKAETSFSRKKHIVRTMVNNHLSNVTAFV